MLRPLLPVCAAVGALTLAAQDPAPVRPAPPTPAPAATTERPKVQNVQFDASTGWPVGVEGVDAVPAAAPATTAATATATPLPTAPGKAARAGDGAAKSKGQRVEPAESARSAGDDAPPLASGTQLGSPLLDVYQATQGPGEWRRLGGVVVWWRVTIHGAQGEEIGMRELTHTADSAFAERDRLEFADGRTFGRFGAQVYAERNGMPMPSWAEQAGHDLQLFGMQLRLPWLFGDANTFAVVAKDVEDRGGERLRKVVVEQRPPAGLDVLGPELEPTPRDRYEVLYEPSSGLPREFTHRFAFSLQTRRVVLDDWREFQNLRLPFRRSYVDEAMRQTTVLEILRIEPQRVTERDFRLL